MNMSKFISVYFTEEEQICGFFYIIMTMKKLIN